MKSVLWRVAKLLSYIEDARCLKVKLAKCSCYDTCHNIHEFPGGKCGRCVKLTNLPPPCAVVMKSRNLNFLEPSGLVQACNGTALSY